MTRKETDEKLMSTLEAIAVEDPINDWIFSRISPYTRGRILEVGCGIGTFTRRLIGHGAVVAIDPWAMAIERCRATLDGQAEFLPVGIENLPADMPRGFQAVVCLNVLEHIDDDRGALSTMKELLVPGGHLLLLVPAGRWLYGSLDRAFGHARRYGKAQLRGRLREAGFAVQQIGHFNLLGVPGWVIASKIMRSEDLSRRMLRFYRMLMPPFRWLEDHVPIPLGLSLMAVARRPELSR